MILLILAIIVLLVGIILIIIGNKKIWWSRDNYYFIGGILTAISGTALIVMIIILLLKPLNYKKFKIKYETTKNMITEKNDIRDATFTNNLLEINQEILTCREYINSKWVGIFQNKKICNMELLSKENK